MNLIVCFLVETRGLGKEFFLEGYISHHLGGLEYCNINRDAYKDQMRSGEQTIHAHVVRHSDRYVLFSVAFRYLPVVNFIISMSC